MFELMFTNAFGEFENVKPETAKEACEIWFREECTLWIHGLHYSHLPAWMFFRAYGM